MPSNRNESGGLYVHVPFCVQKCPYCDFYSITDQDLKEAYVDALMHEMELSGDLSVTFDSLYIGGGTPSLLDTTHIDKIIEKAGKTFTLLPDVEITIEVNPGTVDLQLLKDYRSAGINRINIGVQSFQDNVLKMLGRSHIRRESHWTIRWAREAGFDNLGIDLIYGYPGQFKSAWLHEMQEAIGFFPQHISCYILTYEPGTPMEKDLQKGLIKPIGDEWIEVHFITMMDYLPSYGYKPYEVSNFAKSDSENPEKDYRSRHNMKYWTFVPYKGFGPSAHSFIEPVRSWNVKDVKKYIEALNADKLPVAEEETLSREQQMIEWVYLGLRQTEGIRIEDFNDTFEIDFHSMFGDVVTDFEEKGWLELEQTRCALTLKGMLLLDSITSELISHLDG